MKKLIALIGFVIVCVQIIEAQQSPCEKTFNKAKGLFAAQNYSEAKTQFQKVVDNCDSNKEIAQGYIKLCDEWIRLSNDSKNAQETDSRKICELNEEIDSLKVVVENKDFDLIRARNIITQWETKDEEQLTTIEANKKEIQRLQEQNGKLLSYQKSEKALSDSIKVFSRELNYYLRNVRCRNKKKPFVNCDTILDISDIIEAMRDNIRLASNRRQKQ